MGIVCSTHGDLAHCACLFFVWSLVLSHDEHVGVDIISVSVEDFVEEKQFWVGN